MENCAVQVCPCPEASCPRWTISFASAGCRSTGRADHMGSDLDLATIKDLEESRQTLFIAVVVPFACRQIWIFRIDLRHRAFGSAGRLCATLHLHRNGDNHANAVWPERACGKFVLFTHRVCERDRRWHGACHGCEGSSFN